MGLFQVVELQQGSLESPPPMVELDSSKDKREEVDHGEGLALS